MMPSKSSNTTALQRLRNNLLAKKKTTVPAGSTEVPDVPTRGIAALNKSGNKDHDAASTSSKGEPLQTKQVRFDETVRVKPIRSCASMTQSEKKALWMRKSDTMAVRREAFATAQKVYNFEDKANPASYESTHWNIYESCIIMEEAPGLSDTALLHNWTRLGTEWRGLEKQSMPELREHRCHRVKVYVQTVVRMSRTAKLMNPVQRQKLIRRTARSISHPDRLYAEVMGKADQDAVAFDSFETEGITRNLGETAASGEGANHNDRGLQNVDSVGDTQPLAAKMA